MRPKTDILTLKLYPDHDESLIRKMDKKMANALPSLREGHFWFISAKEQISEETVEYTLIKPCKTLDEWELEHKPSHNIDPSNIVNCELKVATNSSEYGDLMECIRSNLPAHHNEFWWTVKSVHHPLGCESIFTLVNPVKDKEVKLDMMKYGAEFSSTVKEDVLDFSMLDTITPKLIVASDTPVYNDLTEAHLKKQPYLHNNFWWSVNRMERHSESHATFTLKDPIKDRAAKVDMMTNPNNPRGIISKAPPIIPKRDIIYIAGAISGNVSANRHKFAAAKHNILASSTNAVVLNPAELPDGLTQAQYMSICLPMVMTADTVYMLVGWEASKGAVTEHALAEKLCINIEYQRNSGE